MPLFAGVLVVSGLLAVLLTAGLHNQSHLLGAAPAASAGSGVVFVIDGASPGDLQSPSLRHIAALQQTGTTYDNAWVGQMEPSLPASNATLGTGAFPRDDGLIGTQWRDPSSGQLVRPADPDQVQLARLDQIMEARGLRPLAAAIKTHNPRSRVLSVGSCGAADAAGTWPADYVLCPLRNGGSWAAGDVTGHAPPAGAIGNPAWNVPVASGRALGPAIEAWQLGQQDHWIARYAVWAMKKTRPQLTVINFPEVEQIARYVPPRQRNRVVRQLMLGIDRDIGSITSEVLREGRYAHTFFVITSDQAISPAYVTMRRQVFKDAVLAAGGQKVYVQTDNSALIGLRDVLQAQPVAQAIQAAHLHAVDAIYYKSQGGAYHLQFAAAHLPARFADATRYLLSTMASDASPDVVVALSPHTSTASRRRGGYQTAAGGLSMQWDNQHIPLIFSGAGVVRGLTSHYPATLADISPTVARLLGLDTTALDGFELGDAVIDPGSNALDQQAATARKLAPLVAALKRRLETGPR